MSGLALALGAVVAGALVTEIVFSYPGLGTLTLTAIQNRDYFLLQGIFLFIIIGVLIANFIVDIAYVIIDPRTRVGMQGGAVMAVSGPTEPSSQPPAAPAPRPAAGARRRDAPGGTSAPSSSTSRSGTGSS